VVVLSNDHPAAATSELSVEQFSMLPHIGITSVGDDAHFIDDALAEHGLARLISAKVPLHSLISTLIGSQAVAVLPRRVAAGLTLYAPLTTRALPFVSPRIALSMIWHRRLDNDPACRWLRSTLRATVAHPSS
jgi:DNA-binding transcriptional LysR family regulator